MAIFGPKFLPLRPVVGDETRYVFLEYILTYGHVEGEHFIELALYGVRAPLPPYMMFFMFSDGPVEGALGNRANCSVPLRPLANYFSRRSGWNRKLALSSCCMCGLHLRVLDLMKMPSLTSCGVARVALGCTRDGPRQLMILTRHCNDCRAWWLGVLRCRQWRGPWERIRRTMPSIPGTVHKSRKWRSRNYRRRSVRGSVSNGERSASR